MNEPAESETVAVRSATLRPDISRITLHGIPHQAGIAAKFFRAIGDLQVNVDDIIQSVSSGGKNVTMSFTVSAARTDEALAASKKIGAQLNADEVEVTRDLARLRIVGMGMRSHSGVAAKLFEAIAAEKVNIENISTAEIVISILVPESEGRRAIDAVYAAFGLEPEQE